MSVLHPLLEFLEFRFAECDRVFRRCVPHFVRHLLQDIVCRIEEIRNQIRQGQRRSLKEMAEKFEVDLNAE